MPGSTQELITVATPAVGADWSQVVPAGQTWRLIAFGAQIVTEATAGNRRLSVRCDAGASTDTFLATVANSAITQNTTVLFSGWQGGESVSHTSATMQVGLPPGGLILPSGYRIRALTDGIQPLDAWTQIRILAQVWGALT